MGIRYGVRAGAIPGRPLVRTRIALHLLPLVSEQVVEVAVIPLGRVAGPRAFQACGERVDALAGAGAVLPAQPLLLDARAFGLRADQFRLAGAMALAERVTADDQRDGFLIVHGHPAEGLANVPAGGDRVGIAVGPFRIHVDQAHLDGPQRILQVPVAGIALVVEPDVLGTPVDVEFGLPDIRAPAGETECLESHRFQSAVAGQDHEIGPGDFSAVLLLDRPQQHARLVQVAVIGPAVDGREALVTGPAPAAAVADPVGARTVPRHSDEQRAVVTVVRRPPVLRRGHQVEDVLLHGVQVERPELFGVVERLAHGIGLGGLLVKNAQFQLVGPPVPIDRTAAGTGLLGSARDRASCIIHGSLLRMFCLIVAAADRPPARESGTSQLRLVSLRRYEFRCSDSLEATTNRRQRPL